MAEKTAITTLRMPLPIKKRLREMARKQHRSLSMQVLAVIEAGLAQMERAHGDGSAQTPARK